MILPEPLATPKAGAGVSADAEWPSIGVVIPCWNAEKWIARAIQSVLDENYPNLDVIVIDDGSTDDSLEIVKSFGNRIQWESGPNLGACKARNRGASISQSDFLFFLDADDYIEGQFLEGLAGALAGTGAQLAIGPTVVETEQGTRGSVRQFTRNSTRAQLISSTTRFEGIQTGAVLWDRDFFNSLGGWDVQLLRLQDYFLILLALSRCSSFTVSHSGTWVITEHSSPERVSRRRNVQTELSVLRGYQRYIQAIEKCLNPEDSVFIAEHLYYTALQLSMWDLKRDSEAAMDLCRRLGLRTHPGTLLHSLTCRMFGIEFKEKLSRLKRSIFYLR